MTEPIGTPAPPALQEAPRKASRTRVILMLTLGGVVLAFGGCALFLSNLNFNGGGSSSKDTLSAIGAIVFIAGALSFIVGVLWGIARLIDRRFDRAKTK